MENSKPAYYCFGINDLDYKVSENEKIIQADGSYKFKRVWTCPFYTCWSHMLGRCYSDKSLLSRPSYASCSVSRSWERASNFKAWMEQQDWEGNHLDKDLLIRNNKIYSPETCLFIPPIVNGFITEKRKNSGAYPAGVNFDPKRLKFVAKCSNPFTGKTVFLGRFTSPEDAHHAWVSTKLCFAKQLAEQQEDPRVAEALIRRYENYEA